MGASRALRAFVAVSMVLGSLALSTGVAAAAPPSNDDIGSPTVVGSLPFTVTENIADATTQPEDNNDCGTMSNTVWFSVTSASTATLRVSTDGSSFTPFVLVFDATTATIVDCHFNGLSFVANAGDSYQVMVGFEFGGGQPGDLTFTMTESTPPSNDNFAGATVISGLPYSAAPIDVSAATTEPSDPTPCGFPADHSVWYRFDATVDRKVIVELTSSFQPLPVAFTGTPDALTQVGLCGGQSLSFDTLAGQTYWVMVTAPFGVGDGQLTFTMRQVNEVTGITVKRTDPVSRDGTAHLSGTITCTTSGTVIVSASVFQTYNRPPITVDGFNITTLLCDHTADWDLPIGGLPPFVPGKMSVVLTGSSNESGTSVSSNQTITLTRAHS